MKCKAITTSVLLSLSLFSAEAQACRAIYSEEKAAQVMNDAAFIGLARTLEVTRDEKNTISSVTFKPIFSYKNTANFTHDTNITVNFNTEELTSCDYRPSYAHTIYEIILFEENGNYRLGNQFDMGLNQNWKKLRQEVKYIP